MPEEFIDPFVRFDQSFTLAHEAPPADPTAMALGTSAHQGKSSVRIVLLKAFDSRGFCFYTNYESRKSEDLMANPYASLCIYWYWLGQQVRVEGRVEKTTPQESDEYFATRHRRSQLGAWASHQSRPLDSRAALLQRIAEFETKFEGKPVPRPPNWGGWRLVPNRIEFWYDGENRLHDRIVYTRPKDIEPWACFRLNP